jgi:hypothetical protein
MCGIVVFAALLTCAFSGKVAWAVASYGVSLHATVTIEDTPVRSLLGFVDLDQHVRPAEEPTLFPSFVSTLGSTNVDLDDFQITIDAESTGAAFFTGAGEPASAEAITRSLGVLGIVNSSDLGFFLDVRVQGYFEFRGSVDQDLSEVAGTNFALSFWGSALDGLPSHPFLVSYYTSTRDEGIDTEFDLVTSTFLLGIDETYSILIPPSFSEPEPGVIAIEIFELGILGQAGGQALSLYDGMSPRILADFDPGPDLQLPSEFFVPEPASCVLLLVAAIGTVCCRKASRCAGSIRATASSKKRFSALEFSCMEARLSFGGGIANSANRCVPQFFMRSWPGRFLKKV